MHATRVLAVVRRDEGIGGPIRDRVLARRRARRGRPLRVWSLARISAEAHQHRLEEERRHQSTQAVAVLGSGADTRATKSDAASGEEQARKPD